MIEGKQVTWFPSYGAEMRGGTANCTVIVSDEMIGSPVVYTPDLLIAMNRASIERFEAQLKKRGLLIYDSSLVKGFNFRKNIYPVGVPATRIAGALGNTRAANMVMLGALIAKTALLKKTSFERLLSLTHASRNNTVTLNQRAILEGMNYREDKKSGHC